MNLQVVGLHSDIHFFMHTAGVETVASLIDDRYDDVLCQKPELGMSSTTVDDLNPALP